MLSDFFFKTALRRQPDPEMPQRWSLLSCPMQSAFNILAYARILHRSKGRKTAEMSGKYRSWESWVDSKHKQEAGSLGMNENERHKGKKGNRNGERDPLGLMKAQAPVTVIENCNYQEGCRTFWGTPLFPPRTLFPSYLAYSLPVRTNPWLFHFPCSSLPHSSRLLLQGSHFRPVCKPERERACVENGTEWPGGKDNLI